MNATARDTARLPQNRGLVSPASIAPGIISTTTLSTISITVIESVSEAKAMPAALLNGIPPATSGQSVIEYPKRNASTTDRVTVAALLQPNATPVTMPSTSPIAQPVRQWSVAETARA